jgi:2-polyprenyl-3-methyl-5-hydroxy-6-metoxy-1,4-benzoquinol methylase
MENAIQKLLCDLGICREQSIQPFFPKVRDRDDISVLKCHESDVIFLSSSEHMDMTHYQNTDSFDYWRASKRSEAVLACQEDSQRRYNQFKHLISGKKWLDVGTGSGGILDLFRPDKVEITAVEPQMNALLALQKDGYTAFDSIDSVSSQDFDVISLFHVLEHVTNPVDMLTNLRKKLSASGKIIIEVPHARDFLLSKLDLNAFKAFTFWSEHLILHTQESLQVFLQEAGFKEIKINGFQRYPLSNHLYWLAKGQPGGQKHWSELNTTELDNAYSKMLDKNKATDTLIAIASVK